MTEFTIEYNPYLVESTFRRNGEELSTSSKFGGKKGERLQLLFDKTTNWEGLLEEIAEACNDDEIKIRFRGRRIDFDDLKYALNQYEGEVKFQLEFVEARNDNDLIKELDKIFAGIKEKDFPQFDEKNDWREEVFEKYEEVKNGIFDINVIATMSSGKSTLINSILHTELLPAQNKATTATIGNILDNDAMEDFEVEGYSADHQLIYPRTKADAELLEKYNADENVRYINIEGNIPSIPSDKIRLCLRDTPGPNNSRNENHGRITNSIIREKNAVVVYVMNATQFGIEDDKQLLFNISNEMKKAGKQSRDRFIFVINKCDALDVEKGETVDTLLQDVTEYLKEFKIENPILIPTSARLALVIRKEQKGEKLTRKERGVLESIEDFVELPLLHFEKYAVVSSSILETLEGKVEEYHSDEEQWDLEALIHTGVPVVEATIKEYIEKYAYPIKIKDAINDMLAILKETDMKETFYKEINEDTKKLEMVKKEIEELKNKIAEGEELTKNFRDTIEDFNLDEENGKKEERQKLERDIARLSRPYNNKCKVDKGEADLLIDEFLEKIENYQKDFRDSIQSKMDQEVFNKGRALLIEYKKLVIEIFNSVKVTGYDFGKLSELRSFYISDLDSIKKSNEKERYRTEIRWMNNPEREGFLGRLKFWKPKEISYDVDVLDGKDINVENVVGGITARYKNQHMENVQSIYKQANEKIEGYKNIFEQNIENLTKKLNEVQVQLDKDTKDGDKLKTRVKENKEFLGWIKEKESEIEGLLSF